MPAWWSTQVGPQPPVDPRIITKDVVVEQRTARTVFGYSQSDNANNVVDLWEYDFGNTSGAPGPPLRHIHKDFVTNYNNLTAGVYIRDLFTNEKLYDGSETLVAQTEYVHDDTPLASAPGIVQNLTVGAQRGNRTKIRRWRNTDGAWLVSTLTYDVAGNVISQTNPRGYLK
jgi:YD repeat-containing protein